MAAGDDLTLGSGYDPSKPPLLPVLPTPPPSPTLVVVNMPEIPAVDDYSYDVQYNEVLITQAMNRGWNTWARSVDPILIGSYLQCSLMDGVSGALFALGPEGMEGRPITAFHHSLAIDPGGVKAHENGVIKNTLRATHQLESVVRIYRHHDNSIVYVVTTAGKETEVYTSATENPYPSFMPLYVYGYLYSSGDKVLAAEFASGTVQYGSV